MKTRFGRQAVEQNEVARSSPMFVMIQWDGGRSELRSRGLQFTTMVDDVALAASIAPTRICTGNSCTCDSVGSGLLLTLPKLRLLRMNAMIAREAVQEVSLLVRSRPT